MKQRLFEDWVIPLGLVVLIVGAIVWIWNNVPGLK